MTTTRRKTTKKGKKAPRKRAVKLTGDIPTQTALAQLFGVADTTIIYWRKRGMPRNEDGSFTLAAVEAWRSDYTARRSGSKVIDGDSEEANRRWREARARKLELETALLEESVIPVDEHVRSLEERGVFFRRKLMSISRRMAARLANVSAPGEIESELNAEFIELLWLAYEKGGRKRDDPDGDATAPT